MPNTDFAQYFAEFTGGFQQKNPRKGQNFAVIELITPKFCMIGALNALDSVSFPKFAQI